MLYEIGIAYTIIAGAMAIMLYYLGLKEGKSKKARNYLIWATLFLGASFGGIEWSLYQLGISLFSFFNFPLMSFFAIWFAFVIWSFERINERKIWITFLIAMITLTIVGIYCPNCVQF